HAIGKSGEIQARLLSATEYSGGLLACDGPRQSASDLARLAGVAADGTPQRIDEQSLGLVHDLRGQVLEGQRGGIAAEIIGDSVHFPAPLFSASSLALHSLRRR